MEMRAVLGVDAAKQAALYRDDKTIEKLEQQIENLTHASCDADVLEAVLEFWWLSMSASGNVPYLLAYNTLASSYRQFDQAIAPLVAQSTDVNLYIDFLDAVKKKQPLKASKICAQIMKQDSEAVLSVTRLAVESEIAAAS